MAFEIERKFLVVSSDYKDMASDARHLVQGYLSADADATVRVRVVNDNRAFITIKGRSDISGLVRSEWEYEIPVDDALAMLRCTHDRIIDKTRNIVKAADGHVWEVDEFHGRHEGLVIAEIELSSTDESFEKPNFVGEEVTGDVRYYNSQLAGIE